MADITEVGNSSNSYSFNSTKLDEFLPLIEIRPDGIKDLHTDLIQGDELTNTTETVTLSKHLDSNKRTFTLQALTTSKKKIKLKFKVKKGAEIKGWFDQDNDGYIEPQLSISDEKAKITSEKKLFKKFGDYLEVELEMEASEATEFFLDFYANDNNDTFDGEFENVHCGRVKIIKKVACLCQADDWAELSPLVAEANKVQYGSNLTWEESPECYHYALEELKRLGYWITTERWNKKWDGTKELSEGIFQLYVAEAVAGMKKGAQEGMFKDALIYLKEAMKNSTPVMVGLDYHSGYANDDLTTDHFGAITGCGRDGDNNLYFYVTDNAFADQKYYCDCEKFEIRSADNGRVISQVRKSKKL